MFLFVFFSMGRGSRDTQKGTVTDAVPNQQLLLRWYALSQRNEVHAMLLCACCSHKGYPKMGLLCRARNAELRLCCFQEFIQLQQRFCAEFIQLQKFCAVIRIVCLVLEPSSCHFGDECQSRILSVKRETPLHTFVAL